MKTIKPGQLVYWKGEASIVLEFKGFSELILRSVESGGTDLARLNDVTTHLTPEAATYYGGKHLVAEDKEWNTALERFETIKPLLQLESRTKEDVQKVADKTGKGIATIYRWLSLFEETGLVSSLLRQKRSDSGATKLDPEVDQLIQAQIKEHYLKEERKSALKVYGFIKSECKKLDLPVPHANTVYSRIRAIDDKEAVKKRLGRKVSSQKYVPKTGSFPGADYPNAVVQIDHTPVDIIVVDEEHRLPIGRPFLTIAIEVATKMISGFEMTLEHPSASSAGLCIAHAILPKEGWLARRGIDAEWPIYGKMDKIHVDNAKEFRGNMLRRACQQHGITLEFRPKGQPNYGPHVERAFRTFMKEVQSLPGTTFSNIASKLEYNSEGKACMTLSELELWFTVFLVYCYHHRPHRGINKVPPIKLYMQSIFGTKDKPGIGLPAPIEDEETLRLDFTPYIERTIQRQGVEFEYIHYYSDVLRKWIGSKDPENPNKSRKFIFAVDPKDVSQIYFFDPDTHRYVPVPYLNTARPSVSLWELRAAKKQLSNDDLYAADEEMIFKGIEKLREIEADAVEKTRLAKQQRSTEKRKRRMAERRKKWSDSDISNIEPLTDSTEVDENDSDDIQPFSDIELY